MFSANRTMIKIQAFPCPDWMTRNWQSRRGSTGLLDFQIKTQEATAVTVESAVPSGPWKFQDGTQEAFALRKVSFGMGLKPWIQHGELRERCEVHNSQFEKI